MSQFELLREMLKKNTVTENTVETYTGIINAIKSMVLKIGFVILLFIYMKRT